MKQRISRYEKIIPKQVELPSWGEGYIKLYRRLKMNLIRIHNERKLKCERCGLYHRYQNPQTGKIYKLCASCGVQALTELCNFSEDYKKEEGGAE